MVTKVLNPMSPNQKYNKKILFTAALLDALTIAIGAFGAHGLKNLVDATSVASFETGVRYQMYHAIVLLFVGSYAGFSDKTQLLIFRIFLLGIIFFSGSIYLLALQEMLPFSVRFLGPITPIGGLFFILGWVIMARAFLKKINV